MAGSPGPRKQKRSLATADSRLPESEEAEEAAPLTPEAAASEAKTPEAKTPETETASTAGGAIGSLSARAARLAHKLAQSGLVAAGLAPLAAAAATLWLVLPTLAPGVGGWDTAEFQAVAAVLGTGHPTGYPSYVILGFIATHVLPFGEAAFRMNVLQALLAALTMACTVGIVQYLTGMRLVALATGLLLLVMPTWSPAVVSLPNRSQFGVTPLFWRMATHADYHMLHVALVALLFLLLLVWERWRTGDDPDRRRLADRWLVAAAVVYGIAFANHGLAWLLPPAIALFVTAVAPWLILRWRVVVACAAAVAITIGVLYAELPIRAAMHAPLVYGHPDTLSGFLYVVMGQQFGGSLVDPYGQLPAKYADVTGMLAAWLGPLSYLGLIGLASSLVRRPRYVLLALVAAVPTAVFGASYVNADLERYFLVPLFVAFTFVGLGLADGIAILVGLVSLASNWVLRSNEAAGPEDAAADGVPPEPAPEPAYSRRGDAGFGDPSWWPALLVLEFVAAAVLVATSINVTSTRQQVSGTASGAVGLQELSRDAWMRAMLAPADKGGLPANAVIVSWWSDSTTLWYGQKVDGLRPDIYVVDDRTRLDDNLGSVFNVIDRYLGDRPVFLDRLSGGLDGMDALSRLYDLSAYRLPGNYQIAQVISKKE